MFSSSHLACSIASPFDQVHLKLTKTQSHWTSLPSRCCRVLQKNERILCSDTGWEILSRSQQSAVEVSSRSTVSSIAPMSQHCCLYDSVYHSLLNKLAKSLSYYHCLPLQACKSSCSNLQLVEKVKKREKLWQTISGLTVNFGGIAEVGWHTPHIVGIINQQVRFYHVGWKKIFPWWLPSWSVTSMSWITFEVVEEKPDIAHGASCQHDFWVFGESDGWCWLFVNAFDGFLEYFVLTEDSNDTGVIGGHNHGSIYKIEGINEWSRSWRVWSESSQKRVILERILFWFIHKRTQ